MTPQAFREDLQSSIEATLQGEARRNELTIAYVRVVALALTAALDFMLYVQPAGLTLPYAFSPANALLAGAWLMVALVVAAALRRGWYRLWLRIVAPLIDGLMLLSLFLCIFVTVPAVDYLAAAVVNVGIACAILAVSGALRLHRAAAWLTTATAVVIFAIIAPLGPQPLPETVFSCVLLAGFGLMGTWLSDIARRSVESEVGRLVLGRFLPQEVVAGAHQDAFALLTQPRRLEATVVVTDLRGFTGHAESLPPELVLEQLNRIQSTLAEAVHAHGGRVDKFLGDGMLAVFGMEGAPTGHARAAVASALAMPGALFTATEAAGLTARLGIGVHSGPIVAGCLGSGARLEFTVLGDTVNTAARLQDLTKEVGAELLVSGATREAVLREGRDPGWQWTSMGSPSIRGRQGALELFTVASGAG